MRTNIIGCARCGEDHKDLEMEKLTIPIDIPDTNGNKVEYWSMCPNLNEPILIIVISQV